LGKRKTPGAIETTSLRAKELIARIELATSSFFEKRGLAGKKTCGALILFALTDY